MATTVRLLRLPVLSIYISITAPGQGISLPTSLSAFFGHLSTRGLGGEQHLCSRVPSVSESFPDCWQTSLCSSSRESWKYDTEARNTGTNILHSQVKIYFFILKMIANFTQSTFSSWFFMEVYKHRRDVCLERDKGQNVEKRVTCQRS